jgi:anti-anti-sigma factor
MSFTARISKGKCKAKIEGDMTIYTASEIKDKLFKKLAKCQAMELDLSQVVEFDTAGFQLLALLKSEAERNETFVLMKNHSSTVLDILELYHFSDQIEREFENHDNANTTAMTGEQLS